MKNLNISIVLSEDEFDYLDKIDHNKNEAVRKLIEYHKVPKINVSDILAELYTLKKENDILRYEIEELNE